MNAEANGQPLPQGIEQTVAEVEKYLEANPKNGKGWELLAPVYLRLGRFDDAVTARRNVLEIFGPDAARLGDLGEAITVASNGVVTPEAKGLFQRANAADPQDVMAQYYLGLNAKQEGRRDEAVQRWTALISGANEGAEWLPMVKNALARVDEKGPSVVAAAQPAVAAPPDHSDGAIEAMVARLAERLKTNGSDVPGWIQLVRSYRVLGNADKAKAAIADAPAALANDQDGCNVWGRVFRAWNLKPLPMPLVAARRTGVIGGQRRTPGPNASEESPPPRDGAGQRNGMIEAWFRGWPSAWRKRLRRRPIAAPDQGLLRCSANATRRWPPPPVPAARSPATATICAASAS